MHVLDSPERDWLQSRYETLRMAALGEPVPPQCRSGLVLFLHRGLWGWGRALLAPAASEPPSHGPSPGFLAPEQNRVVIQIFAAMAMDSQHRRER